MGDMMDWDALYDEIADTPQYKLEKLSLQLSHVIADAMKSRCMSRTDLARSLGVSAPMVTKLLSGRSNFTLKTLVGVAHVLDCEFDPVMRPKEYGVAADYVPGEHLREYIKVSAERVSNVTRSVSVKTEVQLPIYGDTDWCFRMSERVDNMLLERPAA